MRSSRARPHSGDEHPDTERVRRALNALKPVLDAFVRSTLTGVPGVRVSSDTDMQSLLKTMLAHPVHFFSGRPGESLKVHVHALKDARNRIAHDRAFSARESRQAINAAALVAEAIGAPREMVASIDALHGPAGEGRSDLPPESAEHRAPGATFTVSAKRESTTMPRRTTEGSQRRSKPTQRDSMRAIWMRCAPDEDSAVREYAAAELRGEVSRDKNAYRQTPEQYARRLLRDGRKKGWLDDTRADASSASSGPN